MKDRDAADRLIGETLEEAAALIESGWTKGALARDGKVNRCAPEAGSAVAFSTLGAISRANVSRRAKNPAGFFADFLARRSGASQAFIDLAGWNDADERSQEEVVNALREAARTAKRETTA